LLPKEINLGGTGLKDNEVDTYEESYRRVLKNINGQEKDPTRCKGRTWVIVELDAYNAIPSNIATSNALSGR